MSTQSMMNRVLVPGLLLLAFGMARPALADVLTHHYDNGRTGADLQETILNTTNVNTRQFGRLFSRPVDGQIYAQPLYVARVRMTGKGVRNVVYVATEHNNVYAFDADDPQMAAPLWHINLGPFCPSTDFYTPPVLDMNQGVGITGTPAIDPLTRTLYVVAKTKEGDTYFQRLHALDIATGAERPGSPVAIQASLPGTGDAAVNGQVAFDPKMHLQRPGLLLSRGVVYLTFGSHGDHTPYHGWVLGYDTVTLRQTLVYNTSLDGGGGAIWQAGGGPAADAAGDIYVSTGNGTSNAQSGGASYSDCLLKLHPAATGLTLADWFMPFNVAALNLQDADLGSCGPLVLPGTDLLLGGSKEGKLYLVSRTAMGHFHANDDSQIVQVFPACAGHIHGTPICWSRTRQDMLVYVWSENDHLKAFAFKDGHLETTPQAQSPMVAPPGMPGGFLTVSANGDTPGTGIVWASRPDRENANWNTVPGILEAFDASDVSKELWNSKQNAARDDGGNFAKFCPPVVANGKVYLATFSDQLQVYGLLPPERPKLTAVTVSLTQIAGGHPVNGAVTLDAPASAGGLTVSLSSDSPSIVRLPAGVSVPAGARSAAFVVSCRPVSAARLVTISAQLAGQTRAVSVKVTPTHTRRRRARHARS